MNIPTKSYQIGPFSVAVSTDVAEIDRGIESFYQGFKPVNAKFFDFHISLEQPRGVRRWLRPQIDFVFDGIRPFKPLPRTQGLALFEWGLNWCITNHCHEYLTVHAAVIERNGFSLILPAPPGAGKSTLCAALVCAGWRLLSDELALIGLEGANCIAPLARPVCLKNASISIIKQASPSSRFGKTCTGTNKGDVAHMMAPARSVELIDECAVGRLIVFPRYIVNSKTILTRRSKATTFFEMARQSFNFHVLGSKGFEALESVVTRSDCYDFEYSNLDEAIELMTELSDQQLVSGVSAEEF